MRLVFWADRAGAAARVSVPADLQGARSAFSAARSLPGLAVRPCVRRRSTAFSAVPGATCAGGILCRFKAMLRPPASAASDGRRLCLLRGSLPAQTAPFRTRRIIPRPADLRGAKSAFSAARSLPGLAVRPCVHRRSTAFSAVPGATVRAAFCAGSKQCSALRRQPRPMGGACACFGAARLLRQSRSAHVVLSPYVGRPPSWPASRSAPATRKSMLPDSKTVSRGVWMRLRYSSPRRVRRRAVTPMPRRKEA